MTFVMQDSWSVVGEPKLERIRARLDNGRRVALALLITTLIHVVIIGFLILKLVEPSAGRLQAVPRKQNLTVIDLATESASVTSASIPSVALGAQLKPLKTVTDTAPIVASEWQLVQLRVAASSTSAKPTNHAANTYVGFNSDGANAGNGSYDPYTNAGYYPTREAQHAATLFAGTASTVQTPMVDRVSLDAAARRFRQLQPNAHGTVSFLVQSTATPKITSAVAIGGTLAPAYVAQLGALLQQMAFITGPSGQSVEIRIGPLSFG